MRIREVLQLRCSLCVFYVRAGGGHGREREQGRGIYGTPNLWTMEFVGCAGQRMNSGGRFVGRAVGGSVAAD